ncbi:hypothetical protein CYMTET_2883 [Cymbomonas tetramitiformis]|uniref:Uncharacterized protein n=1 Tax=Cymbomonas tetramitiformis TaxID=36881 RepID=A0AAE0LLM7_9CHLO|nr:hypothetical protein CYMTET_2883 [Cymbomonas tetramitiformis]
MQTPAEAYAAQEGTQELAPNKGILKITLIPGDSERRACYGDQVHFTYKLKYAPGDPNAGREFHQGQVERYLIGSKMICTGLSTVLQSMVEGETAKARLKIAYAPHDFAAELELTLLTVHPSATLTAEDAGVVRWRTGQPQYIEPPLQPVAAALGCHVSIRYKITPDADEAEAAPDESWRTACFQVGKGEQVEGLEKGVMGLIPKQVACLRISEEYLRPDIEAPPSWAAGESIKLHVAVDQVRRMTGRHVEQVDSAAPERRSQEAGLLRGQILAAKGSVRMQQLVVLGRAALGVE